MLFFRVMQPFICLPALVLAVQGGKQVEPWQGAGSWGWAPSAWSLLSTSANLQLSHHLLLLLLQSKFLTPAPRCSSGLGLMGLVFHLVTAFLLPLEHLPCLSCNSLTSFHLLAVAFF